MKYLFCALLILLSHALLSIHSLSPGWEYQDENLKVNSDEFSKAKKSKIFRHFEKITFGKQSNSTPDKDAKISILIGVVSMLLLATGYVLTFAILLQLWPFLVFSAISLILGIIGFSKGIKAFGKRKKDGAPEKKIRTRALWGMILNGYLLLSLIFLAILFLYYGF